MSTAAASAAVDALGGAELGSPGTPENDGLKAIIDHMANDSSPARADRSRAASLDLNQTMLQSMLPDLDASVVAQLVRSGRRAGVAAWRAVAPCLG